MKHGKMLRRLTALALSAAMAASVGFAANPAENVTLDKSASGWEGDQTTVTLSIGATQTKTAADVLEYLRSQEVDYNNNWNVRYRENLSKVKCGDIFEICSVVKSLMLRERVKNLSTGERKMLSSAKNILVSELLLSMNSSYEAVDAQIDQIIEAI